MDPVRDLSGRSVWKKKLRVIAGNLMEEVYGDRSQATEIVSI